MTKGLLRFAINNKEIALPWKTAGDDKQIATLSLVMTIS